MANETSLKKIFSTLSPRRKYLVGVSGGADSVFLLRSLHDLGFRKLIVCHFDHALRPRSSQADARFVKKLSGTLGLDFYSERSKDLRRFAKETKQSIETAARLQRYTFFASCARQTKCRRLILGHHAGDQAETILFNFLRGTGLRGLSGMRSLSQPKIGGLEMELYRPLLGTDKKEILEECKKRNWAWREDASNQTLKHTRNRLRIEALPMLEKIMNRDIRSNILRNAEILRAEEDFLAAQVPEIWKQKKLSLKELKKMPPVILRRCILNWLRYFKICDPGAQEVAEILKLLDIKNGPAKINLPNKHHARRRAGVLFLE
ncbi:MAG: tRNA lysidine(34) synthetase TilS [Chthoniobacterales bacterium]